MKAPTLALALLMAGTAVAFAQEEAPPPKPKTPVINQRQVNQHARIRQGVKSGELTKGEAAKLRSEQRDIRRDKKMAKTDGKVTPAERQEIRKDQNKASRDIYRLKHNEREK
jgi:hypothetical protein